MAVNDAPIPYDSLIGVVVDENMGGRDLLQRFHQSPYARDLAMVQIMMSQTSGAGVYRVDGAPIRGEGDGLFLPAGGGVLYLRTTQEVRAFRLRPNTGSTITLSAQAYRFGAPPSSPVER